MSKKRSDSSGLVYSTDPNFKLPEENPNDINTLPAAEQNLRVKLDAKQRAGKVVTLIQGFEGKEADLEDLGRKLKSYCGTGGSVKDNEIIIQGDNRDKILIWLHKQGFTKAKKI
ncbi:MAG TPA: translation initiation factor [Chitinophagaceae bacterium]|nr:translation initiation factor [Chitinophagaceae bacterium]